MKTVNSIIILLVLLYSCSTKEKHPTLKEDNLLETKTENDGFMYKYYGNSKSLDSVLVLNKEMQRFGKEYFWSNELIRREFNDALYKFGWKSMLSWEYDEDKLLNHCKHYKGHYNHLHVQGYKPNYKKVIK